THSTSDITSGTFPYSRLPISAAQVSNWGDAYTHSNITSGNPHGVSYSNILGTPPTQSTPTLQEVLNAGNTLTTTNSIDTSQLFTVGNSNSYIEFNSDNINT